MYNLMNAHSSLYKSDTSALAERNLTKVELKVKKDIRRVASFGSEAYHETLLQYLRWFRYQSALATIRIYLLACLKPRQDPSV